MGQEVPHAKRILELNPAHPLVQGLNTAFKTSPGNMLPYLNTTYFTAAQLAVFNSIAGGMQDATGVPTTALFATGDVRGNENLELTAPKIPDDARGIHVEAPVAGPQPGRSLR